MANLLITTTGVVGSVEIQEWDITLTHPTTLNTNTEELASTDVLNCTSLQNAIENSWVTVTDLNLNPITNISLSNISSFGTETQSPWNNLDLSVANQSSTDIRFDGGTLTLGDYGAGNHDVANPQRLLGVNSSGLVVEYDYVAPPTGDPVFYKAAGAVTVTGTTLTIDSISGAGVTRTGTGQYDITFNTPANDALYPVIATMAALPQNDDYQWAYLNRTINGFTLEIREQDNGGTAGVLRDSGFSFFVPVL